MTLLDRPAATPRAEGARRLDTGVQRLAGSEAGPVILLEDLPDEVVAALAPLLARRREVFVGSVGEAVAGGIGAGPLAVVGGRSATASSVLRERPEALVVVGPARVDPATAVPVLLVRAEADPDDERVVASGHPVETAHLIDSFLRDPRRAPVAGRRERSRP